MALEAQSKRNIQQQLNVLLATSKNKSYFVGAVTVLFVVFMALFGILPSYSAFTAQGEKNAQKQEAIDKLDTKRTVLDNLVVQQKEKANIFNIFNTIFPEQPEQVAVLKEVEELAIRHNIILLTSAYSEARTNVDVVRKFQTPKQVKAQTLNLLLDGSRSDLNNFISDLEKDIRILDVKNATISRKVGKELEESDPAKEYKLNLQLDYFYFDKAAK